MAAEKDKNALKSQLEAQKGGKMSANDVNGLISNIRTYRNVIKRLTGLEMSVETAQ